MKSMNQCVRGGTNLVSFLNKPCIADIYTYYEVKAFGEKR